jgi:probable rRNA maturation factor
VISIETTNRSGTRVDVREAEALAESVLAAEGVSDGELGIAWVGSDEMRGLKHRHLGIDEATDVLSFPLDGREELPDGEPRALGDVVLCPDVVGEGWREPLVHGLLHLLGYDHGDEMAARERVHAER